MYTNIPRVRHKSVMTETLSLVVVGQVLADSAL